MSENALELYNRTIASQYHFLHFGIVASIGETLDNNDLNQAVASNGFSENNGLVKEWNKGLGWCSVSWAHNT